MKCIFLYTLKPKHFVKLDLFKEKGLVYVDETLGKWHTLICDMNSYVLDIVNLAILPHKSSIGKDVF